MKLFSCIFLLCISSIVFSQSTAIPDPNFEQALIDLGYDTGAPDGVVPTQNINTIENLFLDNKNISDLTGIQDFLSLCFLSCQDNVLTSITLHNPQLNTLYCATNLLNTIDVTECVNLNLLEFTSNKVTNIDLSKNINLVYLFCNDNLLDNIDISKNTLLYELNAAGNKLQNLNVSTNINLVIIFVPFNQITEIDLSNNLLLYSFNCTGNILKKLKLNNLNYSYIWACNNPDLYCVEVDSPYLALIKYRLIDTLSFDSQVQFSSHCGTNQISGNVYFDKNLNCTKENSDIPLQNIIVKASNNIESFCNTDINGNYHFLVDSNQTYHLELLKSNYMIDSYCQPNGMDISSGSSFAVNTNNMGLKLGEFALPRVEISKDRMRRCFRNNTTITYLNDGTKDITNAEIFVDFPEHVSLVSASKSFTTVNENEDIYKFVIPVIPAFSRNYIYIVDSVNCGNEDIRGYTQCIKTWITPKSNLAETKDTSTWDKSSISVDKTAQCIGDSLVRFIIRNNGSGNMKTLQEYRFFYNNELAYSNTFKLNSGDSIVIDATADGSTVRLEADQNSPHPGKSRPRTTIEGCGSPIPSDASLGFWPHSPLDDLDLDIAEVCLEIRDSYDPNEKSVSPSGVTEHNYVPEKEPLHYTIQFQNTGSDVAYNIIVVDTLSQQLDMSTLQVTSASHNYTYTFTGETNPVIAFTFSNINLLDSTTNEGQSHGFISFTISPKADIIPGTEIANFADIYFDYNSAIRTNTVRVNAKDTIIESAKFITVTEVGTSIQNISSNIQIFPNPCNSHLQFSGLENEQYYVSIKNIVGIEVKNQIIQSDKASIDVNNLEPGCYFITITNQKNELKTYKMVKE